MSPHQQPYGIQEICKATSPTLPVEIFVVLVSPRRLDRRAHYYHDSHKTLPAVSFNNVFIWKKRATHIDLAAVQRHANSSGVGVNIDEATPYKVYTAVQPLVSNHLQFDVAFASAS